jgi:hypothetical protein
MSKSTNGLTTDKKNELIFGAFVDLEMLVQDYRRAILWLTHGRHLSSSSVQETRENMRELKGKITYLLDVIEAKTQLPQEFDKRSWLAFFIPSLPQKWLILFDLPNGISKGRNDSFRFRAVFRHKLLIQELQDGRYQPSKGLKDSHYKHFSVNYENDSDRSSAPLVTVNHIWYIFKHLKIKMSEHINL